jgi:hypothetical protein
LQEHFREALQELRYDQKQFHLLASHCVREVMHLHEELHLHEVMKFQCAFHLSSLQPSFALQLRDKDGLLPLVSALYLQGDAYCFHQIQLLDPS